MSNAITAASDAELLRQMLAGDAPAFGSLYDRHQACIYRFALRMTDSEAIAGDVTHDVFLALMRDGDQFDPQRGTLAGYLYGIARHRILKVLKKERTFVSMTDATDSLDETPWSENFVARDNPLLEFSRGETIQAVRQAIQALPAHYREVVLLCNIHELSYEQAAGVLGCAVGTVRSRLHRARLLLLEKLRSFDETEAATQGSFESKAEDQIGLTRARVTI